MLVLTGDDDDKAADPDLADPGPTLTASLKPVPPGPDVTPLGPGDSDDDSGPGTDSEPEPTQEEAIAIVQDFLDEFIDAVNSNDTTTSNELVCSPDVVSDLDPNLKLEQSTKVMINMSLTSAGIHADNLTGDQPSQYSIDVSGEGTDRCVESVRPLKVREFN